MAERAPTRTTNLDGYGNAALPWSRALNELKRRGEGTDVAHFLGTVGPDSRPYVARVGAVWHDGDLYFTSNLATRKARNLESNPTCTIAVKLVGIDLSLYGKSELVADAATLEQIAAIYRDGGWPAEVAGDAVSAPYSAPSAGPAPWHVFRFTFDTVVGGATAEPYGATRWQFAR